MAVHRHPLWPRISLVRRLGHASVKESCLGEAGLLLDDGEVGSLCDEHPTRRSSTVSVVGIKPTVDLQPALPNGATDVARSESSLGHRAHGVTP